MLMHSNYNTLPQYRCTKIMRVIQGNNMQIYIIEKSSSIRTIGGDFVNFWIPWDLSSQTPGTKAGEQSRAHGRALILAEVLVATFWDELQIHAVNESMMCDGSVSCCRLLESSVRE